MNISEKKKQKIDIVLTLYGDSLYELTERIDKNSINYDTVRREAHKVLDESLTNRRLSAILEFPSSLRMGNPRVCKTA